MATLFSKPGERTTLKGSLLRIVYANPENGWTVARLEAAGHEIPVVGNLLGVQPGTPLELHGYWEDDKRFGRQFRVESYVVTQPTSTAGIERFLGGLVHGVGPATAKRLVQEFGLDTLRIIAEEPHKLRKVPGLGRKRVQAIREAWEEQRGIQEIMVFLQGHGIGPNQALRIQRRYGERTIEVVRENPYHLAREVSGIGFRRADAIAQALGIAADSPRRVEAVLEHLLHEAAGEGHCFLPYEILAKRSSSFLGNVGGNRGTLVEAAVLHETEAGRLTVETEDPGRPVFLAPLHRQETGVARRLLQLLQTPVSAPLVDVAAVVRHYERDAALQLSPTQRVALAAALESKVSVITGGPGTGKTTLVRGIVQICRRRKRRVRLAAPTGRAAKRLAEATGSEAATLHRLLEWNPHTGRFQHDRDDPLEGDVFIVDETSMLDVTLAHALLQAIPDYAQLVCVGDADQLPPVGAGAVLTDIIESGRVTTARLEQIFRQRDDSSIVANAHRIRAGEPPKLPQRGVPSDFVLVQRDDPAALLETLCLLVRDRLPARLGVDPTSDIQVLVPMHRGPLGVEAVNQKLQEILNPGGRPVPGTSFRVGDKVMQVRNNYTLDVYNGDVGFVRAVDPEARRLLVQLEDRQVPYEMADLEQLVLAYACTVHKSQGSEYPVVIVVLHAQHHIMLQRNLLYTAVTRAKRQVVVLGQQQALAIALRSSRRQERYTRLKARLLGAGAQ